MATIYTDIYNRTKENITVLRKPGTPEDGITPQLVKFTNPNNEYAGTFTGKCAFNEGSFVNMQLNDISVCNAVLSGVVISGATISGATFADGVDLDKVTSTLDELSGKIEDVKDFSLSARKMQCIRLPEEEYPYQLHDYAVNTINTNYVDAYVYVEAHDDNALPIAKIENALYTVQYDAMRKPVYMRLVQFDLHILNNISNYSQFDGLVSDSVYHFDPYHTVQYADKCKKAVFAWNTGADVSKIDIVFRSAYINADEPDTCVGRINIPLIAKKHKSPVLVKMPTGSKQLPCAARSLATYFYLNIKVEDKTFSGPNNGMKDELVPVKILKSDSTDMFFYLDCPVDTLFVQKNRFTTFYFIEIRPHKFLITDADTSKFFYALDRTQHDIAKMDEKLQLFDKTVHYTGAYVKNNFEKLNNCIKIVNNNGYAAVTSFVMEDQDTHELKKVCIRSGSLVVEDIT